jgi:hypothetical protein
MRRLPQALCLLGLALALTGVAFKLNHLAGAHITTNVGLATLIAGMLWWAAALLWGRSDGPES